MRKRVLSILLIISLLLGSLPLLSMQAAAADTYVVGNHVSIPNSNIPADGSNPYCQCGLTVGSGRHWCCWIYGHNAYYYMWGEYPDYSGNTSYLRNVAAEDRTLTVEHLQKYLAEAVPGALVRIDKASAPSATDSNGHTMIFVKMNDTGDGAFFLEGNYNGKGQTRLIEWRFSSLVSVYTRYTYIKYISWPDAPAYADCVHVYDELGFCTGTCQGEFNWQATFDSSCAGVYTVSASDGIYLRTDRPYAASTEISELIPQGTIVEVLGSVTNHYDDVWYQVSYNGMVGYTNASNLSWLCAGGYVDGYLSNGCQVYPSFGYAIVQTACEPYPLPCDSQVAEDYGYISQPMTDKALASGTLVEVGGIVCNTQGQYWYKVTLSDGTQAYIPSQACHTMVMADPYVKGSVLPDNINGTTNLGGEVYAGGALLHTVQAIVHKGYHASGEGIIQSAVDAVSSTSGYTLYKSAVDYSVPLGKLADYGAGYYSIAVYVDVTNHYLTEDQQVRAVSGVIQAGIDNFTYLNPDPCTHVYDTAWSYDDYDHWHTCTLCGNREDMVAHDFVDGACAECGAKDPYAVTLLEFSGMTMTLGNSLAVNFVLDTAALEGDGHYAVITKTYADGTAPVSVTVPQSEWKIYSGSLCYFTFTGVNAKEMTDAFTAVVYNAAGQQVSVTYTRTIEDYCYGLITKEEAKSSPDAERLALYTDILNYGAAAQDFFSYNTENLANARLTENQQLYATQDVVAEDLRVKGEGYMGSTLSLKNEILMNFVYTNEVADQAAYAVYAFSHHDGGEETVTVPASEFLAYGTSGQYMIVTGMKIADCNQVITVTLYDAEGNTLSTSADSVWSYASRNTAKHAVYTAVLKLAESAYNYFH